MPGVAGGNIIKFNFEKKIQPIRSKRLASYIANTYKTYVRRAFIKICAFLDRVL